MATDLQTISIHQPLKQYVDEQAAVDGLESSEQFVESLIHEDQERRIAAFESVMLKALDSGQVEMTDGELMHDDFLEVLEERHAKLLRDKAQSSERV